MGKSALRLVSALALCLGVVQSSTAFGWYGPAPLFFTPASTSVPQVMNAIDHARKSFHMIMYRLTTQDIIDHVIAAHKRGVDVQIILDNNGVATEKPNGAFHQLSAAGVTVMKSSSLFSISHVKAFIVDNETLYIMTLNLTSISATVRDVGLITKDAALMTFFNDLFKTDVANSKKQTMTSPKHVPDNIVLSPGARDRIEKYIKTARHSIQLEVENFSDPALAQDLIDAAKTGVKVEVLMPRCDLTQNDFDMPIAEQLAKAGVDVYMMPSPMTAQTPYIHQKSIVIDEKTAFLGSENFSHNSLDLARELGVIISEPQQVRQMSDTFNSDTHVSLNGIKAAKAYVCPPSPF
jgi:cardiolipin synthase A/B